MEAHKKMFPIRTLPTKYHRNTKEYNLKPMENKRKDLFGPKPS